MSQKLVEKMSQKPSKKQDNELSAEVVMLLIDKLKSEGNTNTLKRFSATSKVVGQVVEGQFNQIFNTWIDKVFERHNKPVSITINLRGTWPYSQQPWDDEEEEEHTPKFATIVITKNPTTTISVENSTKSPYKIALSIREYLAQPINEMPNWLYMNVKYKTVDKIDMPIADDLEKELRALLTGKSSQTGGKGHRLFLVLDGQKRASLVRETKRGNQYIVKNKKNLLVKNIKEKYKFIWKA